MKILVTGGAGFIGSHIVDEYIKRGHLVVVIDNLSTGKKSNLHPNAVFYKEDISNASIESIIKKERIEVINHHAAQIDVRKSIEYPAKDAKINIEGTINLLEAARKSNVQKIIFASSGGAIYGDASVIPTSESYGPILPVSPYGIGKYTIEHYLRFFYHTYNLRYIALRYSNVYGPRQNVEGEAGVITIFLNSGIEKRDITIFGDGTQIRDFIYVSDVVNANIKALDSNFLGACNISTQKGTDINSLAESISSLIGKPFKIRYQSKRSGEVQKSILMNLKAQEVLRWIPEVSLKAGLKKTLNWIS